MPAEQEDVLDEHSSPFTVKSGKVGQDQIRVRGCRPSKEGARELQCLVKKVRIRSMSFRM